MANPMPDEVQVYEKIQRGEYPVDPKVIELLRHHIGNDLQVIYFCAGVFIDTPDWIIRATCFVNRALYMIYFRSAPAKDLAYICRETLTRAQNIHGVLEKVKATVNKNKGEVLNEVN